MIIAMSKQCDQILELKLALFPLEVAPKVAIAMLPKSYMFSK